MLLKIAQTLAMLFPRCLFHQRLSLAVPVLAYERPDTIWRPLERGLRSDGEDFRAS